MEKISELYIGDETQPNISAIIATLTDTFKGHALFDMMNFDNTGVPGIKGGALIDVGAVLYRQTSDVGCFFRNSSTQFVDISNASDGEHYILVCPSGSSAYFAAVPVGSISVVRDTLYGGYYENATMNRVIGGFRKTESAYSHKWRYAFDPETDKFLKVTSNGLIINSIYKIEEFINSDVVASFAPAVSLVNNSALVHDQLVITKYCTIRNFKITAGAFTGGIKYATVTVKIVKVIDGIEYSNSSWEQTVDISTPHLAERSIPLLIDLRPGTYRIYVTSTPAIGSVGNGIVVPYNASVTQLSYSISDVLFANDGTF